MNKLQKIDAQYPMFVSLNPHIKIDKKNIYAQEVYQHPQFSVRALKGQQLVAGLQAKNRTLFAGAWLGYGFHEDGVASAVQAAKALGIEAPWLNN